MSTVGHLRKGINFLFLSDEIHGKRGRMIESPLDVPGARTPNGRPVPMPGVVSLAQRGSQDWPHFLRGIHGRIPVIT